MLAPTEIFSAPWSPLDPATEAEVAPNAAWDGVAGYFLHQVNAEVTPADRQVKSFTFQAPAGASVCVWIVPMKTAPGDGPGRARLVLLEGSGPTEVAQRLASVTAELTNFSLTANVVGGRTYTAVIEFQSPSLGTEFSRPLVGPITLACP
jgi:hypothetical protein